MSLLVDVRMAGAASRLNMVRLCMFTLRMMENWRILVDDCEKALILIAVVAISGERFAHGERLDEEFWELRAVFPEDRLRQCNISSVAAATGLNRETTRRKVNELVEAGLLVRSTQGRLWFRPGWITVQTAVALTRKQLEALLRVGNDLIRDGVVALS